MVSRSRVDADADGFAVARAELDVGIGVRITAAPADEAAEVLDGNESLGAATPTLGAEPAPPRSRAPVIRPPRARALTPNATAVRTLTREMRCRSRPSNRG